MKLVNVNITLNPEANYKNLNKIRELKDLYLTWCIEGVSPAETPQDILPILRDFEAIDQHFLLLRKKIDNVQSRERGEEICYPDVE